MGDETGNIPRGGLRGLDTLRVNVRIDPNHYVGRCSQNVRGKTKLTLIQYNAVVEYSFHPRAIICRETGGSYD
jgi:hypothetical protein